MKILMTIMFIAGVITALFGDIQKAMFIMLMAIYIQGVKD